MWRQKKERNNPILFKKKERNHFESEEKILKIQFLNKKWTEKEKKIMSFFFATQ
jgi:hypothetical protein